MFLKTMRPTSMKFSFRSLEGIKIKIRSTQRHLGTLCLSLLNRKVAIFLIQSSVRSVGLH